MNYLDKYLDSVVAPTTRRSFLRTTALGLASGSALAACDASEANTSASATPASDSAPAAVAPLSAVEKAEEMDRMHEAGVKSFPAASAGKGNQLFEPSIVGGVKVFDLIAQKIEWETKPGTKVEAWAYNGQVPGPQIRVAEGDRVRLVFRNELEQSTAIHFHGLELPNDVDGVPFITQPPIKPG